MSDGTEKEPKHGPKNMAAQRGITPDPPLCDGHSRIRGWNSCSSRDDKD